MFLTRAETRRTERLRFTTTRWIWSKTAESAGLIACRRALAELEAMRPENPPDRRIAVTVDQLTKVAWFSALGRGRGFSFYPDDEA